MADDSGLCVAALNGAPGVHSARYAGPGASDDDNLRKLLDDLESVGPDRRQAEFHCVIVALAAPSDPAPMIAAGRWAGTIAPAPRGENGFGYDPVFVDLELGVTAAELDPETKNAISHRSRACRALKHQLGFEAPSTV
jgi:XTP/dITP diphosphohydrolase